MRSQTITRRALLRVSVGSVLALSVLGVAACSNTAATPTAAPASKPTTAASSATAAPAASSNSTSSGSISLSQWYHQYGEKGTEQAVMKYAQEYEAAAKNVKVTVTWVPGDYASKLATALAGGSGPDVYEGSPTVAMVKANQVASLDDLFTASVKNDFNSKDLEAATINGHIYAVKMIDDTGALYYRKSVLQKAGVQPPTTFDELTTVAKAITTRQQKGLFIGNDGGISALLTLLPVSAGSQIISASDNKILFDNDNTAKAYEGLAALNKSGSLLIGAPTDWTDPSAFIQGLCAIQWEGLWAYPAINTALKEDFDVLPWPAMKVGSSAGTPVTFWGGWAEMANAQSKQLDAAKALVKWFWIDNQTIQTDWASSYGFHVPPRLSVAKADEKLKTGRPLEFVQNMYSHGIILPPIWDATMGTDLLTAASNIVKFGKPAAAEVKTAADKCAAELATELK
ncbi:MAG TPA: extracellular solute-binding protein [Chloroflexota bacterium]|nr:extracellular solute-binding protein [Chloroflexota bacterium]